MGKFIFGSLLFVGGSIASLHYMGATLFTLLAVALAAMVGAKVASSK